LPVYRSETDPNEFSIERTETGDWRVVGKSIERAAAMTYWEHDQSVRRFQRIMEAIGIDQALRDAGVKPGHMINIGEFELEWED
ncbi:MAG: Obg family GTPase CgtA, partial [Chloroflexi bacterium]|nr:Obg family GTPase CgtA [Chloroflexota bacterium]